MLSKNLKYLRRKNRLSQQNLAVQIGVGRTSLGDYERARTEPDIGTLVRLSDYFSISIDDLIRKDLHKEDYEIMRNRNMRILAITVDKDNRENIELVDSKAEAGYIENFNDPEFVSELPRLYFPNMPDGTFRGFEIRGDSMLPLEAGSIVICSYVENLSDLKDGKTYVIISKSGGIVYKRLRVMSKENSVLLISDNSDYSPFTLPLDEISEIWQYYASVIRSDPAQVVGNMVDERLNAIHRKVNDIHKELSAKVRVH